MRLLNNQNAQKKNTHNTSQETLGVSSLKSGRIDTIQTQDDTILQNMTLPQIEGSQRNLIGLLKLQQFGVKLKKNQYQSIGKESKKDLSFPSIHQSEIKIIKQFNSQEQLEFNEQKSKREDKFKILNKNPKEIELWKIPIVNSLNQIHSRIKICLQQQDIEQAQKGIKQLIETLNTTIQINSMNLFGRCIELIGDLAIQVADYKSAVYFYNKMRLLGDYTGNNILKINSLIHLSETCKLVQKYNESKQLLKKAIQYVWLENRPDIESSIYDKLGIIFYLQGDINKAKDLHERSVGFHLEDNNSPVKKHSVDLLKFPNIKFKCNGVGQTRNDWIRMQFNQNILYVLYYSESQSNEQNKLKFGTNMTYQKQLNTIFTDEEFNIEIGTPNYLTVDGLIQQEYFQNFDPQIIKIHKNMSLKKLFIRGEDHQSKKEAIKLNPKVFKQSFDEKITERINESQKKITNADLFKQQLKQSQNNSVVSQKGIILNKDIGIYNHLTPNRNMEGFNFHMRPNEYKINKFYEDLIQASISAENNNILDFQ